MAAGTDVEDAGLPLDDLVQVVEGEASRWWTRPALTSSLNTSLGPASGSARCRDRRSPEVRRFPPGRLPVGESSHSHDGARRSSPSPISISLSPAMTRDRKRPACELRDELIARIDAGMTRRRNVSSAARTSPATSANATSPTTIRCTSFAAFSSPRAMDPYEGHADPLCHPR